MKDDARGRVMRGRTRRTARQDEEYGLEGRSSGLHVSRPFTPNVVAVRLPHPVVLLLGAIGVAAALTWALPAGADDRRADPIVGRRVAVAGTYHAVEAAPVRPFRAVMAVPRGFAAG